MRWGEKGREREGGEGDSGIACRWEETRGVRLSRGATAIVTSSTVYPHASPHFSPFLSLPLPLLSLASLASLEDLQPRRDDPLLRA